ncbi:MAG: phage tail assembly protein [Pseudomonadota bacterium]
MGPVTITLSEPITAHGETVSALTLEAPRARHLRNLPLTGTPSVGLLLDMAGAVSGLPPSAIDQLSAPDTMRVVEAMAGFLELGPGAMPSS